MKEISKKDLLLKLQESQEFDEMAHKRKDVQGTRTNPNTGEVKPAKFKPYWKSGNETNTPDYWVLNPNQVIGEEKVVVPLDCMELEDFVNENRDWLDSIHALHGLLPELKACKRTTDQPRSKKLGTQYVPTGEKYSEKEAILRKFNPILKNELTDKVNEHLIKCGLPPIQTYENREFVDRYSEITNRRIDWESHDYDFYNSVIDFATAAKELVTKGQTSIQIYRTHMPRQYNPGANWSALRKTEKTSAQFKHNPLTDVYKLPKRGYEKDDKDVAISNNLVVSGNQTNDGYTWNVRFTTTMGNKLKEESRLNSGKFSKDKELASTVSVPFDIQSLNQNQTILEVEPIREGLVNALNDMVRQILEINPKNELIKRIKIQQSTITKRPNMNENELVSLIKDVVSKK